ARRGGEFRHSPHVPHRGADFRDLYPGFHGRYLWKNNARPAHCAPAARDVVQRPRGAERADQTGLRCGARCAEIHRIIKNKMQEMQQNPSRPGRILTTGFLIILGVIAADQYSKWLVLETVLRKAGNAPGFADWFTTPRSLDYFAAQQGDYTTDTLAPF